jgi:glycosyltransferase involved in cell wall biosynthesis
MKILILNTSEDRGGAAVAAKRLFCALQKEGIDVSLLVRDKATDNSNVVSINTSPLKKKINYLRFVWERFIIFLCNQCRRQNLFQVSIANTGTDISRHPLAREADIIHLHWINQGFLSLKDIEKLLKLGKPVVWTMHDMWTCTGICHYSGDCEFYQSQCQSCFFLSSSKGNDLSSKIFLKKKRVFENADLRFAGCSDWLSMRAGKSGILNGKQIQTIPNPLNTSIYYPANNRTQARARWGFPLNKKLLLFGALNISDKRKGMDYLVEASHFLGKRSDIEIIAFGEAKSRITSLFPIPVLFTGYLSDERDINALYNMADVFVIPSLEENLPNTIMEAMACGTPCVGFNTGGIPEMIDHKKNGYVAEYKNAEDLAAGIEWVLENVEALNLSEACVRKVQENYAEQAVVKRYISLYSDALHAI